MFCTQDKKAMNTIQNLSEGSTRRYEHSTKPGFDKTLNFLLVFDYNCRLSQTKFDSKANAIEIQKEILIQVNLVVTLAVALNLNAIMIHEVIVWQPNNFLSSAKEQMNSN